MNFKTKILTTFAGLAVASAAMAHDGVKDPTVQARMHLMEEVKNATGVLGGMAKGSISFDAAQAKSAADSLAASAAAIPAAFEVEATDPASESLPVIWTDFAGFSDKAMALQTAAEAVDTSSLDGVRAGMQAVGRSCGGCHKTYRK